MKRRGYNVEAVGSNNYSDFIKKYPQYVYDNAQVNRFKGTGKDEIEKLMASYGDGARSQISVDWPRGNGHAFMAEQLGRAACRERVESIG